MAPDPLGLFSADEPNQTTSDLPSSTGSTDRLSKPAGKKEPALADSSIFDVPELESRAFEAPVTEAPTVDAPDAKATEIEATPAEASVEAQPIETPPIDAPSIEASLDEAQPADEDEAQPAEEDAAQPADEVSAAEELVEEKPELAAFGDLSAFDGLSSKAKSAEPIVKPRASLPPLLPVEPAAPAVAAIEGAAVEDDDEGEWELGTGEISTAQSDEVTEAIAKVETDRPWRDVDDLDDEDEGEEDDDDLTGIVAKEEEPTAPQGPLVKRPFRDVDDLEDDEDDDPSEHLPTRVLGVPAPAIGQRTVVPPPPSRGAAGSRGAAPLSLPAIPPPPTLPRSVPPSVPPVAFDWILPRGAKRAGSLTLLLGGLAVLLLGVVPLVMVGAWVAGKFSPPQGSLVVTVAGANHGPVETPVVMTDDVPRCKASPCRVTGLEPGTHFVRVTAPGYQQMAPRAVAVEKGGEVVLHVELAREPSRVTVADTTPAKTQTPLDLDDPSVKADALPRSGKVATPAESVNTSASLASRAATATATAPASAEQGKLNLSSTPPSNVVLDGKPLGVTPRAGIKVKPGKHSVVFIHPKLGRKTARANVKPGGTSNVSVRFR